MNDIGKTVEATTKSLEIIELIKSTDGTRLSDIARQLDYSKSTVHTHLNTLRSHGYVTKNGEVYHLSLKFFHLGQHTRNQDKRYQLVKQKTADLAGKLAHAIDFDVKVNDKIMTLFHQADQSTEVGVREGDYFHIHASATGKAILAELPAQEVEHILTHKDLVANTEYTITDPEELRRELDVIKNRGYAVIDQEWLEGLRSVAVVVPHPNGNVLGALSAGGPTYRLTKDEIKSTIAPQLASSSAELGEAFKNIY
jgi:DNA-binding IclR family transcriptional regulator